MSKLVPDEGDAADKAPGDAPLGPDDVKAGIRGYVIGFVLAVVLTAISFYLAKTTLFWKPSLPIALSVMAIAQMGVHLVFFLHLTSGSENINNSMALAFGVLIVMLLVFGSLWIMSHMQHGMVPMEHLMKMQR